MKRTTSGLLATLAFLIVFTSCKKNVVEPLKSLPEKYQQRSAGACPQVTLRVGIGNTPNEQGNYLASLDVAWNNQTTSMKAIQVTITQITNTGERVPYTDFIFGLPGQNEIVFDFMELSPNTVGVEAKAESYLTERVKGKLCSVVISSAHL